MVHMLALTHIPKINKSEYNKKVKDTKGKREKMMLPKTAINLAKIEMANRPGIES